MILVIFMSKSDTVCVTGGFDKKVHTVRNTTIQKFIEDLCLSSGSTFEGKVNASKKILHIHQKAPIVLQRNKILFPSVSAKRDDCIWVNASAIKTFKRKGSSTVVYFLDDSNYEVPIEYRSFKRQVSRCRQYEEYLRQGMFLE